MAASTRLTRIAIVDFALDQAQLDTGFRAKGRLWLNIALDRIGQRYKYKFWRKTADVSFLAGIRSYALPADFDRSDSCYYLQPTGVQGFPIAILEPYEFDQIAAGNINGFPEAATIDLINSKIVFASAPASVNGQQYRLNYFKKAPQYSLDSTDDASNVEFEDQDLLIQETLQIAMKSTDDERYQAQKEEAKESNQTFQRNMFESDGTSQVSLNQFNFRNTRRRSRSRGFRP